MPCDAHSTQQSMVVTHLSTPSVSEHRCSRHNHRTVTQDLSWTGLVSTSVPWALVPPKPQHGCRHRRLVSSITQPLVAHLIATCDSSNTSSSPVTHPTLQEWPHRWPSFIPDLVSASKTSETLCENSMRILRLLSEEVFDFARLDLTQVGGASQPAAWRGVAWRLTPTALCVVGVERWGSGRRN